MRSASQDIFVLHLIHCTKINTHVECVCVRRHGWRMPFKPPDWKKRFGYGQATVCVPVRESVFISFSLHRSPSRSIYLCRFVPSDSGSSAWYACAPRLARSRWHEIFFFIVWILSYTAFVWFLIRSRSQPSSTIPNCVYVACTIRLSPLIRCRSVDRSSLLYLCCVLCFVFAGKSLLLRIVVFVVVVVLFCRRKLVCMRVLLAGTLLFVVGFIALLRIVDSVCLFGVCARASVFDMKCPVHRQT